MEDNYDGPETNCQYLKRLWDAALEYETDPVPVRGPPRRPSRLRPLALRRPSMGDGRGRWLRLQRRAVLLGAAVLRWTWAGRLTQVAR
jgi:hypothetical protein